MIAAVICIVVGAAVIAWRLSRKPDISQYTDGVIVIRKRDGVQTIDRVIIRGRQKK